MQTNPHELLSTIPSNQRIKIASLNFLNNPDRYEQRIQMLVEELETLQPHIICLQEVLHSKEEELILSMLQTGYGYYAKSVKALGRNKANLTSGNYTFSKIPFETSEEILADIPGEIGLVVTRYEYNTQEVNVINGHFFFGPTREYHRCLQAVAADTYAVARKTENPNAIVVLLGDLNATPDADTIMYLKGKRTVDKQSTLWIDTFAYLGTPEQEITSYSDTYWGITTARNANDPIFPNIAESRRIDYVLCHNWVYGKPGTPINFNLWGDKVHPMFGFEISDHYGVVSEIYCP